jgi:hypothetical protein
MSRTWAILVNNTIGNVVIAEEDFIASHPDLSQFERIDITDYNPQPSIMWTLENNKFKAPQSVRPKAEHMIEGNALEIEVKS